MNRLWDLKILRVLLLSTGCGRLLDLNTFLAFSLYIDCKDHVSFGERVDGKK